MDGGAIGWQAGFNIVAGLLGALGAFLLKQFSDELKTIKADLSKLPETYARRDDMKSLSDDLKARLVRIEDKLDRIADK